MARSSDDLLESAMREAQQGRYDAAVTRLQTGIRDDSARVALYLWLVEYARCSRTLSDVEAYLQKGAEQNPRNPLLHLALALVAQYRGVPSEAYSHSKRALELGATHPLALELLVEAALAAKKTSSLPALLRKLRKEPSQSHLYDLGYAIWRYRIRNWRRAQTTLDGYLQKRPLDLYGHMLLGDVLLGQKDWRQASARYRWALERLAQGWDRLRLQLLHRLGNAYALPAKMDSAAFYWRQAHDLAVRRGALFQKIELAQQLLPAYKQTDRPQELVAVGQDAYQTARDLGRLKTAAELGRHLGYGHSKLGDFQTAARVYLEATRLAEQAEDRTTRVHAYVELGKTEFKLGRLDSAAQHLNAAVELATTPKLSQARFRALLVLGDVHRARGNTEAARQHYLKVLRFGQKTQDHDLTETCFLKLANLYLKPGANLDDAGYYLTMADYLAKQTFRVQSAAHLGWLRGKLALLQNDPEKAETYFLKAVEVGRKTGAYLGMVAGYAGLVRTYIRDGFADLAAPQADSALSFLTEFFSLCEAQPTMEFFDLREELFVPAVEAYALKGDLNKVLHTIELYKSIEALRRRPGLRYLVRLAPADSLRRRIDEAGEEIQQLWQRMWESWRRDKRDNLANLGQLRQSIDDLVQTRRELMAQLRTDFPAYYALCYATGSDAYSVSAPLKRLNATLVHYFVHDRATGVLVVRPDSLFYRSLDVSAEQLRALVAPLLGDDAFRVDKATKLYQEIFAPVRAWLPPNTLLCISGDEALNGFPFETLVTNKAADLDSARFLIEDFSVVYAPSVRHLLTPKAGPNWQQDALAVFLGGRADPADGHSNGHTVAVPDLQAGEVFRDERCSPENLVAAAGRYRMVMLTLPVEWQDGSELFARLKFASGEPLAFHELFNQRLASEMFLLDLSQTGGQHSSTWPSQRLLFEALQFAGVSTVYSSGWRTHQVAPSALVSHLRDGLAAGLNHAEALRNAKLQYMKEVSHDPARWASYTLLGNPAVSKYSGAQLKYVIPLTLLGVLLLAAYVVRHYLRMRAEQAS